MHLSCRLVQLSSLLGALFLADAASAQVVATSGTADPPALLWRDPGPIASRDLYWGSGREDRLPKGPFVFVEEKTSGTQPKIVVTDSRGVTWDVKFGEEAKAEIAANRLLHALGYFTEEIYLVRSGRIDELSGLQEVAEHVSSRGEFSNARFRRRDENVVALKEKWAFDENPFQGQRELSGLQILMTMVNNWDIRGSENNEVMRVTTPDGKQERRYLVGDLGATFGRMGGRISGRSKWDLEDYLDEGFIEKTEGEVLHLDYDGWDSGLDKVPIGHARWFSSLTSQLSLEQLQRAFDAAGATPEEIDGFSNRLMQKIKALEAAVK